MKRIGMFFLILFSLVLLTGCVGASTKYVDGAKIEEVWSVGVFTPTVQMTRMSKCVVKEIHHPPAPNSYGDGWTETKTTEPCQVIGTNKDGFMNSTAGPIAPVLMNGATTVGAAGIINDGLRNQNVSPGDNINMNNSSSSSSRNTNRNSVSTCQGNCGRRGGGRP